MRIQKKNHWKKAQSQVITTVLLILLSIAAVSIVFGVVIPFVKDKLSEGDCVNVVGKIEIMDNPKYSCYEPITNNNNLLVQIHVNDVSELLAGFKIEFESSGDTKVVDITKGATGNNEELGVCMNSACGKNLGRIVLPGNNEARTYKINNIGSDTPDFMSVYAVLKDGTICDVSSTLKEIPECSQ